MIESTSLPWVVQAGGADCTVMVSRDGSCGPTSCNGRAAMAVEARYPYDGSVWLVLLCERHGAEVPAAEVLTPAQEAHAEWRRVQKAQALAGKSWEATAPLRPGRRRRH